MELHGWHINKTNPIPSEGQEKAEHQANLQR